MASTQVQGGAVVSDKNAPQNQVQTFGLITNNAYATQLQLTDTVDWSGSTTIPYPAVILSGQNGTFVQQGPLPHGSKGGVIYADSVASTARKWLVAYHTPDNKVYVEAGLTVSGWNVVKENLEKSGSTTSFTDHQFGGKAKASISDGKLIITFSN